MASEMLDKKVIKALNVDTRREIVKMLSKRPYTASELAKITNKHVTTITQHLNTLEQSGLVHKKESVNKWKYYELSDKGEKLFKTQYYTWIVTLGVSALVFLGGLYRLYVPETITATQEIMQKSADSSGAALPAAASEAAQIAPALDLFAIMLVSIALIGAAYSAWKIKRIRDVFY